jgi:hypothetical protein
MQCAASHRLFMLPKFLARSYKPPAIIPMRRLWESILEPPTAPWLLWKVESPLLSPTQRVAAPHPLWLPSLRLATGLWARWVSHPPVVAVRSFACAQLAGLPDKSLTQTDRIHRASLQTDCQAPGCGEPREHLFLRQTLHWTQDERGQG